MDKLYTPYDLAEMLQISYATVLRYIRAGKIKVVRVGGYRVTQEEVERIKNEGIK